MIKILKDIKKAKKELMKYSHLMESADNTQSVKEEMWLSIVDDVHINYNKGCEIRVMDYFEQVSYNYGSARQNLKHLQNAYELGCIDWFGNGDDEGWTQTYILRGSLTKDEVEIFCYTMHLGFSYEGVGQSFTNDVRPHRDKDNNWKIFQSGGLDI